MIDGSADADGDRAWRHRAEATVDGDASVALRRAVDLLAITGFTIQSRETDTAKLTGPGLKSTNQNPLLGASAVDLRSDNGRLVLDADLGGTRFLRLFVRWFPPALLLGISVPFLVVVAAGIMPTLALLPVALVAGLQLVLWAIVGPRMGRGIERRTVQALDNLVHNASFSP